MTDAIPNPNSPRRGGGASPRRLRWLLLVGGLALLAAAGCGDSDSTPSSTATENTAAAVPAENGFVGSVEGTDAFVAIVPGAEETVVYVCDGDDEIALWFRGASDAAGAIDFTRVGAGISARFEGGGYVGTVTLADGSVHDLAATVAGPDAGLWVAHGEAAVSAEIAAAWIVDDEGAERGALLRSGRFERTPRFRRGGVAFGTTRLAVSRIVTPNNVVTSTGIIAPSNIVAPNNIIAPNNIVAPNNRS